MNINLQKVGESLIKIALYITGAIVIVFALVGSICGILLMTSYAAEHKLDGITNAISTMMSAILVVGFITKLILYVGLLLFIIGLIINWRKMKNGKHNKLRK